MYTIAWRLGWQKLPQICPIEITTHHEQTQNTELGKQSHTYSKTTKKLEILQVHFRPIKCEIYQNSPYSSQIIRNHPIFSLEIMIGLTRSKSPPTLRKKLVLEAWPLPIYAFRVTKKYQFLQNFIWNGHFAWTDKNTWLWRVSHVQT